MTNTNADCSVETENQSVEVEQKIKISAPAAMSNTNVQSGPGTADVVASGMGKTDENDGELGGEKQTSDNIDNTVGTIKLSDKCFCKCSCVVIPIITSLLSVVPLIISFFIFKDGSKGWSFGVGLSKLIVSCVFGVLVFVSGLVFSMKKCKMTVKFEFFSDLLKCSPADKEMLKKAMDILVDL